MPRIVPESSMVSKSRIAPSKSSARVVIVVDGISLDTLRQYSPVGSYCSIRYVDKAPFINRVIHRFRVIHKPPVALSTGLSTGCGQPVIHRFIHTLGITHPLPVDNSSPPLWISFFVMCR